MKGTALGVLTLLACTLGASSAQAKDEKSGFAPYTWEVTPVLTLNLPFDLWGVSGPLAGFGVRVARTLPVGGLEAGITLEQRDNDHVDTFDLAYRYELNAETLNTFFVLGAHYSIFNLHQKFDMTTGLPLTPTTDAGSYINFLIGMGVQLPLSSMTAFKLAMRYYFHPQTWLLLETGLGFRF